MGGLNWGTYTNKKKKAGVGLIPGDVYKQRNKWLEGGLHLGMNTNKKKEKLEGDSHWGTYKNKKKKSWRGLTQGDL